MKILMLFVDMLRPNRFNLYNKSIKKNILDHFFYNFGGNVYTNCFSPAPDTPRSMACFYSGLLPSQNGCDSRIKWPTYFLETKESIFDEFIENNYELTFFSNPNERKLGLFPENISKMNNHNHNFDLKGYLKNIKLKKNHLVFISIPDYHWALQDYGYTSKAEQHALIQTKKSIDIIFNSLNKDDFDHIFIFSDHGFKFSKQRKKEEWYHFINRDRSNIFLIHRNKDEQELKYNNKLCSIQDLKDTIRDIFGKKNNFSLLNNKERKYIVIEDHFSISPPTVNQNVDIWGIIFKDKYYVRSLEKAFILDYNSNIISNEINQDFDEILKKSSQFSKYYDEYQKVFLYKKLFATSKLKQNKFMNGQNRKILSNLEIKFYFLIDFFKSF